MWVFTFAISIAMIGGAFFFVARLFLSLSR